MQYYIGLIHKEADSDYGVSFPDFLGVVTAGTSLDDAQAMAEEALALHVDGLVEDDEALPEPSTLDAVMELPDSKGENTRTAREMSVSIEFIDENGGGAGVRLRKRQRAKLPK